MKKLLYSLLTLGIIACGVLLYVGNYLVDYAICPTDNYGKNYEVAYAMVYGKYPEMKAWHDSLVAHGNWRDTTLVNGEGMVLHGILIEHDTVPSGAMMMIHGYCDDAPVMMRYAYCDYEMLGCNVLLPERRNCGLSEGDHITFGWDDHIDMHLWVEMMHHIWPDQPIAVHGLSMGAATTMMMSGDEWADSLNVAGFIEDCGYSSTWDQLSYNLSTEFGLPAFPILHVASLVNYLRHGWWFSNGDAVGQVAKSTKPMLFIHGDADDFVPTSMVYEVYEAKQTGYKELWLTPGCRHAKSIHDHWEEYCQRLGCFLNTIQPTNP